MLPSIRHQYRPSLAAVNTPDSSRYVLFDTEVSAFIESSSCMNLVWTFRQQRLPINSVSNRLTAHARVGLKCIDTIRLFGGFSSSSSLPLHPSLDCSVTAAPCRASKVEVETVGRRRRFLIKLKGFRDNNDSVADVASSGPSSVR